MDSSEVNDLTGTENENGKEIKMLRKQEKIGLEIRKLNHEMNRSLEMQVKAEGIDEVTLMHGWIMRYLYENREKEIYQKDIEKHFSIGRSTVTNIIQLMEKKGFIERQAVQSDARLKKVLLTEKGEKTHETIEALIIQLNQNMMEGIKPEELQTFLQVLSKIRQNIEKQKTERQKEMNKGKNKAEEHKKEEKKKGEMRE